MQDFEDDLEEDFPVVDVISREDLKKGLADGSVVLIDVREESEFREGRIPGSILMPLSRFRPADLPPATPGKRIVLTCRSGQRTQQAMAIAQIQGREDVTTHYAGSMLDWVAAGEKVEV